ncbi:MAG: GntR family transcriptional regulator [Bacillota bacterium]
MRLGTKDYVYEEIKNKIICGQMEPNQDVIEKSLAKELEVSRTPLRAALQQLEFEELLVRKQNGRLKVAPLSITEAREIFEIRSILEGKIARDATKHATEKDIYHLKNITLLINKAKKQGLEDDHIQYGMEFHSYLYELSGNKTAKKILLTLNNHINRYRRLGLIQTTDSTENQLDDHALILDHMIKGDAHQAELISQQHVMKSLDTAIKKMEELY